MAAAGNGLPQRAQGCRVGLVALTTRPNHFAGPLGAVVAAFSPDGAYLAVGCTREIRVWTSGPAR